MKGDISMQRLRVLLRVISVVFVVVFLLMFLLRMLGSGLVAEGTVLARLLLWRPFNMAYESMLVAIHVVWGGFLWRASENPLEHRSLTCCTHIRRADCARTFHLRPACGGTNWPAGTCRL